jgi:hypothetical protein
MFRRGLVSASQRFVQCISGEVLSRQAKVDEVVAGRALRPCISFRGTLEVPTSIDLGRVKPFRIHFRRIEHDIVCCAIASTKKVRLESSHSTVGFIPVGDLPLMHESDALCGVLMI